MGKKPQPKPSINKEKAGAFLAKVGRGLKEIVSTHPMALGFVILAASSAGLIVARKEADGKTWSRSAADELSGLYVGTSSIMATMATAPIIASAIGAAGSILTERVKKAPAVAE